MVNTPPSAYKINAVMSAAMAFALRLREEDPGIEDDETSFILTLESETDATELLVRIIRVSLEAEALANAVDARMKDLAARKARFLRREEDARQVALDIMETLGLPKYPHAEFSVSINKGKQSVVITDESKIPRALMNRPPPVPDKTAIKKLLLDGHEIAGAELSNGSSSITIRKK